MFQSKSNWLISCGIMIVPGLFGTLMSATEMREPAEVTIFYLGGIVWLLFKSGLIDALSVLDKFHENLLIGVEIAIIVTLFLMWLTLLLLPLTFRKAKRYPTRIFVFQSIFSIGNALIGILIVHDQLDLF